MSSSIDGTSAQQPATNSLDSNEMGAASSVELEMRAVNVIRGLAMDAPAKADSGHSGTAMALAPLAHVLWTRIMDYDPSNPLWPDRDRFVLSCGHASILLYSMLYLTGYGLELDDIRNFRQLGSRTPGHPEHGHTSGVEVTTGPLGQGVANGVGLGIAERFLRTKFGSELCSHYTYVIAGDGCLEEGISHEAASLAGHLGLGRLIYIYDDNHITIDGPTELSYSDNVAERFSAYGWHVESVGEIANDLDALESAIKRAKNVDDQPSLIILRSHIGWPAPGLTDSNQAHGTPFSPDEIEATKKLLGLPPKESFWVPADVLEFYRESGKRGSVLRRAWEERFAKWGGDKASWDAAQNGHALNGWEVKLPKFDTGKPIPTRKAINTCIKATMNSIPGLMAGSADLTGNTGVELDVPEPQAKSSPGGNQLYYGIREHAMGAVMTGMALHGGVTPIGGTFFVFSDYMRGAVRLAALSNAHVIYSWTHDSVGLGEDGPTHQPIEHLASLRAMPGLSLIRPADANECAQAWRLAVDGQGPFALVLSRQNLPVLESSALRCEQGLSRGGYVLVDPDENAGSGGIENAGSGGIDVVLVSTGSEVHVCVEAAILLKERGVRSRVVSLPWWKRFEDQDASYRESVLPKAIPTLAVEAGSSFGWDRYADEMVCIDSFGTSAPGQAALEYFGITPENVAKRAQELISKSHKQ